MAEASYVQSSFLGGEWSKSAQGRIDRPDYRTAMNRCLNAIPIEAGAWTRRPGTRHAGTTRSGGAGRIIEFGFRESAPYGMEFTDGHLRMRNGTSLAMTNDAATVSSISTASPAVVTTSAAHGWSTSDDVTFTFPDTLCPLLQNRVFKITVTDTDKFSLADAVTGTAIDGSTLGWATPATPATVTRILDIETPYIGSLWSSLRSVQAEDAAILLHGRVAPRLISVSRQPTDLSFAEFDLDEAVFKDGPYFDPIKSGALLTPSAATGNITLTISFPAYVSTKAYSVGDFVTSSSVNYRSLQSQNQNHTPASSATYWEAVSAGLAVGPNGFLSSDIGRMIRIFSEPPLWESTTGVNYVAGNVVAFNNTYWTALKSMTGATISTGQTSTDQPGVKTDTWAVNPTAAKWTWGKITGLGNLISGALSGSTNFGDMTNNGGIDAAFDGVLSKVYGASASYTALLGPGGFFSSYVGKNYSGASAQAIGNASVVPSSDRSFTGDTGTNYTVRFRLYAKASAPSASNDGTLLGETQFTGDLNTAVSILSNDTTTTWNYVWIEATVTNLTGTTGRAIFVAQVQFFTPTGTGASSTGVTFQIIGDNLLYTTPIRTWRLGLYSDTTGWPKCGCYHEGRIWLSGAVPNRIDSSKSNGVDGINIDMAPTDSSGAVADNNAISYIFNSKEINSIFWMEPEQQGIICGTQTSEWLVQASANNNKLTPTSIQAHLVSRNGCANAEPRHAGLTLTFIHKFKHKIMEYFADVFSGKFASPNLSKNAKHLATRSIEEIAYQQELTPILWSRCLDGTLIGMSYKRESLMSSQEPSFAGWHQHVLGSGRTIESLSIGASVTGHELDAPHFVTSDGTTRHVEVLTNLFEEGSSLADAWFLDDAISPSSWEIETVNGVDYLKLYGLWHLNGATATAWIGGIDAGDFAVASGAMTIQLPAAKGEVTTAYINGLEPFSAVVGYPFTSQGQAVRPATPQESGARTGPALAKTRRTHNYGALFVDTKGISFGTEFTKLHVTNFKSPGGTPYGVADLFSGVHFEPLHDEYSFDSMICWQITRPYPATIAALTGFVQTQD